MSQMTTDIFCLSKSQSCRVPLVKQELSTLPKYQSLFLVFKGEFAVVPTDKIEGGTYHQKFPLR